MVEIKLTEDVFEQIKDFKYEYLTKEQSSLVDKLILNEEIKEHYKKYGLCEECKQPNTSSDWCLSCNGKRFQQNFQNWTSGNHEIDELIQRTQLNATNYKQVIEWIEYDRFENIEYLVKGGFGTIYKATWKDEYIHCWDSKNSQWIRNDYYNGGRVALKCLDNSKDITDQVLRNVESYITVNGLPGVIRCYGITKDPKTNNLTIVMQYAMNSSLRQYLNNKFSSLTWPNKLYNLYRIASNLANIHDKNLVHCDFHSGNILSWSDRSTVITDLGLCKLVNEKSAKSEKRIYGVLPYVAPEILRGEEYNQANDIYSFGIIAYEFCTGYPPYYDIEHDESLAIGICNGQRPNSNYKIPQLILDIINQCWDADPLKRPNARDLDKLFYNLWERALYESNSTIKRQIKEADEVNEDLPLSSPSLISSILSYTTHPQAIYTSRLLDFKNLPEPKNSSEEKCTRSDSLKIDFTKLDVKDESN